MLDGATGIVVAVSGGPDSVALLDMLARLVVGIGGRGLGVTEDESTRRRKRHVNSHSASLNSPQPPTPIPRLHVAHLDHKLRSNESDEDAEFVRALADRLGLQITISSVDVRAAAEGSGRGIEETARELRYNFLLRVANENNCDRIAVGHTMTDQAETFLMRLVRGAGVRGLAAMRPVSSVPGLDAEKAEGRRQKAAAEGLLSAFCFLPSVLLIRPLLYITREEVEDYCRERSLEFRTDSTNLSLHYTRNRIRSEVLPAIEAINPQVVHSIARAAEHLASDQDVLNGLATAFLDAARIESSVALHNRDGIGVRYSVHSLLEQPAGVRRRMIIEAVRRACAVGEITTAHVAAVEALIEHEASGKHITLPGRLEVWREFDALVFRPRTPAVETAPYKSAISSECPHAEAGGFRFELRRRVPESLKLVIEEVRHEKERVGQNWMMAALDDQKLPEQLVIRPRRPGERAHVVGQPQTKKLKNLMIDHRIPSSRRANWPIVTTPEGCYVWSPGLPPSLDFAARDETKDLATLRASAV